MSKNRLGSTNSIHSTAGSVPRVNTVTNVLRRFFSREDSRSPNTPEGNINIKSINIALKKCLKFPIILKIDIISGSIPTPSLGDPSNVINMTGPKYPQGTMRIADQVIEEVDEQLTVTSNRGNDKRPTAQSLFASSNEKLPTRSQPIDVPGSHRTNIDYEQVHSVMQQEHQPYLFPSDAIFSSSAPEEVIIPLPKINIDKSVEFKSVASRSAEKLSMKRIKIDFFSTL